MYFPLGTFSFFDMIVSFFDMVVSFFDMVVSFFVMVVSFFTHGVCGTVSSMLSGLKTRSLGLNTLGTT